VTAKLKRPDYSDDADLDFTRGTIDKAINGL
jgi:hypothetical protein